MSVGERERAAPKRRVHPAGPPKLRPPKVTEADVLERAADLLEEFGWCQGDYCQGSRVSDRAASEVMVADRFCVAGALIRSHSELTGDPPEDGFHMAPYFEAMGFPQYKTADWNDAPDRTSAEVVAKLREAAERARA